MTKTSTYLFSEDLKKKKRKISKFDIFLLLSLILIMMILSFSNAVKKYENIDIKNNIQEKVEQNVENNNMKKKLTKDFDFSSWNANCDWKLLVVNGSNYIPKDYSINTVIFDGLEVDSRIYDPLKNMFKDAKNNGINLTLSSAYRDNDLQEVLYRREVKQYIENGYTESVAESLAKKSVAFPGTSEHATGLAIDLNGVTDDFKYTDEYKWLCNNAYKYGFIQRYSQEKQEITGIISEPWHYRYVGVENAKEITKGNYCLEEYVYSLMN